jgi:hypothetical protein
MNLRIFKAVLFSISLLALFTSCKEEEILEEYVRGGNSLTLSADGNLVVAGYNTSSSKGYEATLVLANSSNGDSIWSKRFGGSYADAFYSVKPSNQGGFIAAGFTNKSSSGSPNMYVVITDGNGNELKALSYGGSYYTQGFSVLAHASVDSGYLVTGYVQKSSTTDRNIYLVRINNDGETLWSKSIGSTSANTYDTVNDAGYNIIAAADSGYYITGSLNGYSSCCGRIFLMKVSPTGDSLWTKTYNYGIGYSLTLTSDGGVAIAGSVQETNNQDIILIKTDTAGTLVWAKTYNSTGYEYGASMVETSDGGFAITGITDGQGYGSQDVYLIRTNSSGVMLWDETYGKGGVEQGYGLVKMNDGGFGITGLSNSDGSFIFLNRTSENGTQQWVKYFQ